MFHSISVAGVVHSDGTVGVEGVIGGGAFAVALEVKRDNSLLIPYTQVSGDIDIGDSLGRILLEVGLGLCGSQHVANQEGEDHTSDNGSSFVHGLY
jgi:hypothetical protein